MIQLHPQLEKDCIILGEFSLCTLLLLNDANYPWFILLPNRDGISEIHQLAETDRQQLLTESMFFCHCLEQVFRPDKLNIAALGNVVPQLHIHHIARYTTDACWPAPVWGAITAKPYNSLQLDHMKSQLANWFDRNNGEEFRWMD
ncbi:MAG: HIT domain-containing protein [Gammaproteobacteria bacterium]|jgi:diadenosine tetraphosphate (Ap4A) HIT family hydrolase|nr:HIT domain-containing protein [Gammaproteobacteria bacterium]